MAALHDLIGPALLGADPGQISLLRQRMDFLIKVNPFTKSAVEMALWDIAGKARGVPVYELLGGKVREIIRTKMMIGAFDVPHVQALATQFLDWGIKCLKVKVGLDLAGDLARVKAVRDVAGPDIALTIDANCGWNVTTARIALERLRPFHLLVAEQPISPGDTEAMASLRSAGIPIMADESVFTLADAWNVLRAHAADVVSIYPGKNGGIAASIEIAHVAQAAGVPCHMGSNLELGIGSAAMLHLACAVANIESETYPADILGPPLPRHRLALRTAKPSTKRGDGARRSRTWRLPGRRPAQPLPGGLNRQETDRKCSTASAGIVPIPGINRQGRQERQEIQIQNTR